MSVVVNLAVRVGGCFNVACSWTPTMTVVTHPGDVCAGAVVNLMLSLRWQSTAEIECHEGWDREVNPNRTEDTG